MENQSYGWFGFFFPLSFLFLFLFYWGGGVGGWGVFCFVGFFGFVGPEKRLRDCKITEDSRIVFDIL